jgi:uracil-DNA glycosylase
VGRMDGVTLQGGIRLFPVYHCGARIMNTHRPMAKQVEDWARIERAMRQGAPRSDNVRIRPPR